MIASKSYAAPREHEHGFRLWPTYHGYRVDCRQLRSELKGTARPAGLSNVKVCADTASTELEAHC